MATSTISRVIGFAFLFFVSSTVFGGELALEKSEKGYRVLIDGTLFTEYITDQQGTPILWPIHGPGGEEMTRAYPMKAKEKEPKDHPHQRSLWFTHGEVNGTDFWGNLKTTIKHEKFTKTDCDGKTATLVSENSWNTPEGKTLCRDVRTFVFSDSKEGRIIDFELTLTAVAEEVKFGDTKEGTFGVRVASSMDVEAKKHGFSSGGTILNAQGDKDNAAWGKRSDWVDYSGSVGDKTVGITIMNHPDSFRYPTYWHVRTYGLFAANPFGEHDFLGKKEKTGEYTLKKDDSIRFRYRVLLHDGEANPLELNKAFEEYKAK